MAKVFGIVILLALYIDFTLLGLCMGQRLMRRIFFVQLD